MIRNFRRSLFTAAAIAAVGTGLVACTPPNQVDSDQKVDTATSVAAAPMSAAPSAAASSSVAKPAAAPVEVKVSKTENVMEGEALTINIAGLNPALGYYAAICAAENPAGPPACTGTLTDPNTAAWINSKGTGTVALNDDGTAVVEITAAATGDGVDCTADKCVVKVFGDHSEGFRDVAAVPVTFAS
ncbi:MAG: neocarzinostatin apoprotein domain-containing protein [Corynebacterium sp.]|uniref:neocarzinostatin apoprotein domain-containing protein n=1 Tax=Corynebacterium sp. TaxID=1720 RepID=UPI0026DC3977|nr:neocarzinostatin apoprotein domain-containing protein [Corynebacterium sp.]MDO5098637.1 neocarzinostatin apoprotein domain-containing protein [Corynebacterium sp.]